VKPEAKLLREAHCRVVRGESLNAVAGDFCRRGITTASGAEWTGQKLGRTLRSAHLAGLRSHAVSDGSRETYAGSWQPIFSLKEHEAILMAIGEHRPAAVTRHLLTGFLRCGACGGPMRSKHSQKAAPRYECSGCNKVTISAPFIEELIDRGTRHVLDSPEAEKALRAAAGTPNRAALVTELAERQAELAQLARDHYVDRLIPREAFLAANEPLQADVRRIEAQLARARRRTVKLPKDLPSLWSAGTLEERRQVLGAIMENITIAPVGKSGGGPGKARPDRVAITWKV
jgi:hypothetical protein